MDRERVYVRDANGRPLQDAEGKDIFDETVFYYPRPEGEHDKNQIDDQIGEYAHAYLEDFNFNSARYTDDDWESFLHHMGGVEGGIIELLKTYYETVFGNRDLPKPEALKEVWHKMQEYETAFAHAGTPLDTSMADIDSAYRLAAEDPDNWQPIEEFYKKMSEFTSEIMFEIMDNNNSYLQNRNNLPDHIEWIDDDKLRDEATELFKNDSNLEEWYIEQNKQYLTTEAEERLSENDYEYAKQHAKEMDHRLGFNPYDVFADEYHRGGVEGESDPRKEISLSQITSILTAMHEIGGVSPAVGTAVNSSSMYVQGIKDTIQTNETVRNIFSNELNRIELDPQTVLRGIEDALNGDVNRIPEIIRTNDAVRQLIEQRQQARERAEEERQIDEARQEAARQLYLEQQKQKAVEQAKYHNMLQPGTETLTPEQLEQMKERGISQRPFPHQYGLQRGTYPGAGRTTMPDYLEPFQISVSPGSSEVGQPGEESDKIPNELMTGLPFHTVEQVDEMPPLGWIGGYADYKEKVMYITEVQSDIMQRTPYMRDPKKSKEFWKKEIVRLQQQYDNTKLAPDYQAPSPRDKIQQKIDAVSQEQQSLDPQSSQFIRNQELLQRLQQNFERAPEGTSFSMQRGGRRFKKLIGLQNKIDEARKNIRAQPQSDTALYKGKDPEKWHDWKSKLENRFKDWVPVFFNVAIREAKRRGFLKARIITADELMKIWATFGGQEKKILFERVYDSTAKQYGAVPLSAYGRNWHEVDLGGEDLRYASRKRIMDNWMKRAFFKEANEWEVIDPGSNKPVWQVTLDTYFSQLQAAETHSDKQIFDMWLADARDKMAPGWEEKVKQYVVDNYYFDPFEGGAPGQQPPIDSTQDIMIRTSLDKFFEVMKRERPELGGAEFETADEGWQQNESGREIFSEWFKNAVHDLPFMFDEAGEFNEPYKTMVRNHVIQTEGFDPFGDDGGEEPGEPGPVAPEAGGGAAVAEPDDDDVSLEELNAMFGEEVYEPGDLDARRRRHDEGRNIADTPPPTADELEDQWR